MTQVPEKIFEKAEKLLALKEGSTNPHEAALAADRLAKLLMRYNIEQAQLKGLDGLAAPEIVMADSAWVDGVNRQQWMVLFLRHLQTIFSIRVAFTKTRVTWIGFREDVDAAMYIFLNLGTKIGWMAYYATGEETARLKRVSGKPGCDALYLKKVFNYHPKRYRSDWIKGCIQGVGLKLESRYAQETANPDTKAIVVRKAKMVDDWVRPRFKGTSYYGVDIRENQAFEKGYEAGLNVEVDPALGQNQTRGTLDQP